MDAIDRARLERDMLDARISKCTNYLCRLLSARDTSSNTEPFDG